MTVSIAETLFDAQGTATPLAKLVNDGCHPIGGIFRLNYNSAVVLTDDFSKKKAGGVPLGGFLLAAAGTQTGLGFKLDDEELILLRVRGTADLPNEADLVQTRLAVVRDATATGQGFDDVTDELTRNELQQSAFDCEVIGTFYTTNSDGIEFGADIDNVVSSAKYQVFLPSEPVLSWLASYPSTDESDLISIGVVRFSSTRRRAQASGVANADVKVHIEDFVARKTAVFGMTRTGKSNTVKTIVTAIASQAAKAQKPVGQLIFDPQGEYANINKQDKTGLKLLGEKTVDSFVRVYRLGEMKKNDPQTRPLGMNFFDPANLEAAAEFVNSAVLNAFGSYAYIKSFASIRWEEPANGAQDRGDHTTWTRARLGFYGLLVASGFRATNFGGSASNGLTFDWKKEEFEAFDKIEENKGLVQPRGRAYVASSPRAALAVTSYMARAGTWNTRSSGEETAFKLIADMLGRASGKAVIRELSGFHSAEAEAMVEDLIWDDMTAGRVAIVDLSQGPGDIPKIISENIVNSLIGRANERFRTDQDPVPFQIVVEEAHNLFERGAKEVKGNPWVRLSKEAAKYKIGLVYATQEVSSVDERILSNTSNWLVAHLNSDKETKELSHYYDFKTWADSLRRCEDLGFVRMKTYSGKYIVPVQVAQFNHSMINAARMVMGLDPVDPSRIDD